jgi:hypothetical protein
MLQVDRAVRGVVYMRVTPWCLIACDPDLQSALAYPRARCFPQNVSLSFKRGPYG